MKHLPTAVLSGLVFLSNAGATDLSYDYIEVQYVDTEIDTGSVDVDGDGLQIGGSVTLNKNLFAFADYSTLDFDGGVDGDRFDIGIGYHTDIKDGMHFEAGLAFVSAEIDVPGFGDVDDNGFAAGVGLRGWVAENFEVRGGIQHVEFDDFDSETSLVLGGQYYFTPQWSAGGSIDIGDDDTSFLIGGRFNFGGTKFGAGRTASAP